MSAGEWVLAVTFGVGVIYLIAQLVGDGFGRGFFRRRAQYNRDLMDQLESRSNEHGSEEQE